MKQIEDLYKNKHRAKVKLISRILRGDWTTAEDVVQEAFVRALRFYPSYDEERGTFETWFNSILSNALRDVQRGMRGPVDIEVDGLSVGDLFLESQLTDSPELRNLIRKRVALTTNQKHKRILELFFIMGYTSMEIGQIEEEASQTNVTTVVTRFRHSLMQ